MRRSKIQLAMGREGTARALGVSTDTVDRLTTKGLLKANRATRRPLYSLDEIRRFLRATNRRKR
jgi:DNA-binding transcriptional MerR regulator